jgi:hypothetical protein
LAGRDYQYYYIRTKSELKEVLLFFEKSKFRYLHLSCHADADGIALTLDDIGIQEMGSLFRPCLKDRRIFFSACEIVTPSLAATLLKETGCLSVVGPSKSVGFDEAVLFWASFYHLMFKNRSMKREDIKLNINRLQSIFISLEIQYFVQSKKRMDTVKSDYKIVTDRYHLGCMGLAAGVHETLIRTGPPASASFSPSSP